MLQIRNSVLEAMVEQARREAPLEACGLLYGRQELIDGIRACRNHLKSRTRFSIAPQELFDFFRFLRRNEQDFLGIYHSHPRTAAEPSAEDIRDFYYPSASYWIISLAAESPEVRCFRWTVGGFKKIEFLAGRHLSLWKSSCYPRLDNL